jgi:uracil-DNA glycosylase
VHEIEHEGGRSRAIPLPHPSGASSWPARPANRALLERALALLGDAFVELKLGARGREPARRSA